MTKTKTSLYSKFPNWTSIFLIISFFSLSDFPSTNWIERKIYFRFPWKNTSTSWWKLYLVNNLIQSWASNQCCYIRLFCHASYFISILDQSGWRDYQKLYGLLTKTMIEYNTVWEGCIENCDNHIDLNRSLSGFCCISQSILEWGWWMRYCLSLSSICCFNSQKPHWPLWPEDMNWATLLGYNISTCVSVNVSAHFDYQRPGCYNMNSKIPLFHNDFHYIVFCFLALPRVWINNFYTLYWKSFVLNACIFTFKRDVRLAVA